MDIQELNKINMVRIIDTVAEYQNESRETIVVGAEEISWIVADLRHLCDKHGIEWMDVVHGSNNLYKEEVMEEADRVIAENKARWEEVRREVEQDD